MRKRISKIYQQLLVSRKRLINRRKSDRAGTVKNQFPKARSRIERAFIAWYQAHQSDWQKPLLLQHRKDGEMSFTLPGLSPHIKISLRAWEFEVYVEWQDRYWDLLMSYNASPEMVNSGYYNLFTLPDHRVIYSRREDLWEAELFEPLLYWINSRLQLTDWLGLYQLCEADGEVSAKWAAPIPKPDPLAITSIPVWTDRNLAEPKQISDTDNGHYHGI